MTTSDPEEHGTRSALHHLAGGTASTRLQTTVALPARAVSFAAAMINIVDADTHHTIDSLGALEPANRGKRRCSTRLSEAVNRWSSRTPEPTNVFAHFPFVTTGDVSAHDDVPLRGRESLIIGALSVIDSRPRIIISDEVARLLEFGSKVEDPSRFIPLAEDSDLIVDIDCAVIRQAALDMAGRQRQRPDLRLSANTSGRYVDRDDFPTPIERIVRRCRRHSGIGRSRAD